MAQCMPVHPIYQFGQFSLWAATDDVKHCLSFAHGHSPGVKQQGLAVASIAQDDPSTLPGDDPFPRARMHRDCNAR